MSSNLVSEVRPLPPALPIERRRLFLVPDVPSRQFSHPSEPRLAPFQQTRAIVAPVMPDAGLAVFDAIPGRACRTASPPAFPLSLMPARYLSVHFREPAGRVARRCPSCGWTDVRRSIAHNATDYLLSVVGLVPYRCRSCSERFHRTRPALPVPVQ